MNEPLPEFSRPLNIARLSPLGNEERLEAKPAERAALAKRFDLIDLPLLKAELTLQPHGGQAIKATGKIEADLIQKCVVTLEPLKAHLEIPIDVTFMPNAGHREDDELSEPGTLEEEIEYFSGTKIDIGEMVAQHLGIAIDPYPRKKGAVLPVTEFGVQTAKPQPLAQLISIVKGAKKQDKAKD